MRCLLFAMLLLAAPLGAFALTWDFDEGTTWGWAAQESWLGNLGGVVPTTVYSEVEEGVWRIAPVPGAQQPAISLLSPLIGEDSDLFDWLTLRLRIIHDRPTGGNLLMKWSNGESRRLTQEMRHGIYPIPHTIEGFSTGRYQYYPIEWENITIDIRALEAAAEAGKKEPIATIFPDTSFIWQDTLFYLQLDLALNLDPQGPADHPAFVEIDWIQLTGAEELLFGELEPRVLAEIGPPGALFAPPRFSVLGRGIGAGPSQGTLGDVDGDGDADLVVVWTYFTAVPEPEGGYDMTSQSGWTLASSDGSGDFAPAREVFLPAEADGFLPVLGIAGGDFNEDGLLDLAFIKGLTAELWLNQGKNNFETILQLSDVFFEALADGDGDGDVDLLVVEYDPLRDDAIWSEAIMWINDGAGGFAHRDRFVFDTEGDFNSVLLAGQPLGEAVRVLWSRVPYGEGGPLLLTQPWAASRSSPLSFETLVNPYDLHLLADLDGDGAVELVGTSERDLLNFADFVTTYHGLALWRVDASGGMKRHTLLGPQVLVPGAGGVLASDLTGDGLLDIAVLDANVATGPALVVLVSQRAGVPVVEGRYRLPGVGDEVLAGDVNGDGATDLVVLGRSVEGGPGGAFVFLNQGVSATAVAAETMATPSTFALGANYPNPFNPATTIPLAVPTEAGDVDVTIYNVLGQPVRQVWAGSLVAGEHQLTWDGGDAQGQPVAAGVYLYRLQVGDHTLIRKMVKLE